MTFMDHFAQTSRTALGGWIKWRTKRREFALLQALMPDRRSAILEVGPGKGELAQLFAAAGYGNYTAVEPNQEMRAALVRRGVRTRNYLIPPIHEADASYDLVVLIDVFEHLPGAQEAQAFIAEARRVLRPGGLLCIASPDYLHWRQDFYNCDYTHNNVTSVRRTLQQFYNSGFRTVRYEYLSGPLSGLPATLLSNAARLLLAFADSNGIDKKPYKLKLTLLRRFLIVGARDNGR
jgi:SAM-dependent methyltransferase